MPNTVSIASDSTRFPAGLQRIVRHADDEAAFPVAFTGYVAIVSGIDGMAGGVVAEDVDALVGLLAE